MKMKTVSDCCSFAFSLTFWTVCAALLLSSDSALATKFDPQDLTIDLSRYTTTASTAAPSTPSSPSGTATPTATPTPTPTATATTTATSTPTATVAVAATSSSSPTASATSTTPAAVDATSSSSPSPSPSSASTPSPSPAEEPSSWFSWFSSSGSAALPSASPAAAPAGDADADALPRWLRAPGPHALRSISIVVPAYNSSAHVLRTLRSVEASVSHLLATHNHGRELRVEVIVVDDASTDNTAMKVAGFVEERRRKGVTNPEWKLVAVQHNLKVGAARNLGVQASTGDVVFFCDSDDLYLENHVFTCFERLERESKAVSVTLGIEIDAESVDREWAISIGQTLPMSTCMLRTFFDLIEGFPEGYYWAIHEDVAFLRLRRHAASLLGAQTINDITKLTSKYMRYPGNALDRQLEQFQKPMSEKKSDEEMRDAEPFMRLKELILTSHDKYLRVQKLPAAHAGKPLNEWDHYWAVYQSLIRKEMRNNNSTYAEELRVAPLKSWRLSHLHTLATVLDQRGNGTYARLVRDLARTVTPTPLDLEDDTVNYHVVSTSSS